MDALLWILEKALPSLLVGLVLAVYNRRENKKEKEREKREETRREEALLSLELNMSNNKLSYATAMALKRGTANGEVEEGIEAYQKAKDKYYAFLNKQAIEHIQK